MRGVHSKLCEVPSLRIFVDLIIGEEASLWPPDRPFLQVYIASLMPQRSNNQGNNIYENKDKAKVIATR